MLLWRVSHVNNRLFIMLLWRVSHVNNRLFIMLLWRVSHVNNRLFIMPTVMLLDPRNEQLKFGDDKYDFLLNPP